RAQAGGNLGFQEGMSIQKVVNGTITQIYTDPLLVVDHTIDGNPFPVSIAVNGPNIEVSVNGFTHPVVTDSDLQPGKYGVHSWAQKITGNADAQYGTMVHQISVAGTTTNFDNAVVADWRRL